MKTNVGSCDKVFRTVVGLAIIGVGLYFRTWWGAVGLLPILVAALGWCPLYVLLGINTCPVRKPEE